MREIIKMTIVQILNNAVDDKLLSENIAKKVVLQRNINQNAGLLPNLKKMQPEKQILH